MHQIPHSILSDSQCTPGGCTGGACACGHAAADHRRWPGCSGEACGECPCAQYDAPDRLTLTLPGLELYKPAAPARPEPEAAGAVAARGPEAAQRAPDAGSLSLDPRPERSLTDAELRAALADPARDVEASRELERRGVAVVAERDLEALRRRDLERAKVAIARAGRLGRRLCPCGSGLPELDGACPRCFPGARP